MNGRHKWSELRAKMSPEHRAAIDASAAEMLRQMPLRYPAIIMTEGQYTLAEFPDCPGCQTFAGPGQDIAAVAREALDGWLESCMDNGENPPRPSEHIEAPAGATIIWISVGR